MGFDFSSVYQLLDVREHKIDSKKIAINELSERYLAAIEKVAAAVDDALGRIGAVRQLPITPSRLHALLAP